MPWHTWLWVAAVLGAGVLGAIVTTFLPSADARSSLGELLRNPGRTLAGWRVRSRLPSVEISVDFDSYQLWLRAQERTARGDLVPTSLDCVVTRVNAAGETVAGTLCPVRPDPVADATTPPFAVAVPTGLSILGTHHANLVPADPESVLGLGYLQMLAGMGVPVPHRQFVHVAVNGSSWGVYAMEAGASDAISVEGVVEENLWVTLDGSEMPVALPASPDRSYAYAQIAGARLDPVSLQPLQAPSGDPVLAEVIGKLSALERGEMRPSELFDPEAVARLMAATMLWYGTPDLDWQTLHLVYSPETGQFDVVPTGWPPDPATPLPVAFTDDPLLQQSYARWLRELGDPVALSSLEVTGDLDSLYVAVGGDPAGLAPLLADHQSQMRAMIAPSRTLFAALTEGEDALHLTLHAVLPFPVEVLELDFGEQGLIAIDHAWVVGNGTVVDEGPGVVLRARAGDTPVEASILVPLEALPSNLDAGWGEMFLVTRFWGLDDTISVMVDHDLGSVVP